MTTHKDSTVVRRLLAALLAVLPACDSNTKSGREGSSGVEGAQGSNPQDGATEGKSMPSTCERQAPELQWTRTFQGGQVPGVNRAHGISVGTDSVFLAGRAMHAPGQGKAIMLRASKKDGTVEWVQWRKPSRSEGSKAIATVALDPSGVVFVGTETVEDSGADEGKGTGLWVQYMGRDATLVWEDHYSQQVGMKNAEATAVARTADNGVVVLGKLEPSENPVLSLWLRKYNLIGGVEWSVIDSIGKSASAAENIAIDDRDGAIYLTGHSVASDAERSWNLMLAAYSSQGEKIGSTVDSVPKALDSGLDIAQLGNGDLAVAGIRKDTDGTRRAFLRRQKKDGRVVWTKMIDGSNRPSSARAIVVDKRDNIYVVGATEANNSGSLKSWIATFDANGNESWRREFVADQDPGVSMSLSFDDIAIDENCQLFVFGTKDENNHRNFLLSAFRI